MDKQTTGQKTCIVLIVIGYIVGVQRCKIAELLIA